MFRANKLVFIPVGIEQVDPQIEKIKEAASIHLEKQLFFSRDIDLTRHYNSQAVSEEHRYWWNKSLYDRRFRTLQKDPWLTRAINGFVLKAFLGIEQFPADVVMITRKSMGKTVETERIYLENHNYALEAPETLFS